MIDILVIAHFLGCLEQGSDARFTYLARELNRTHPDAEVEIATSDFSHATKKKRGKLAQNDLGYKIAFVEEPAYAQNISLRRFYSHWMFGKNMLKFLNERKRPDVIYCAVPSLAVAVAAAKFAKKENIRFIIDVQDLWPEAFRMMFNVPIISTLAFEPMRRKANYIYARADAIVAVSQTYAKRALSVNTHCREAIVAFLGVNLSCFDSYQQAPPLLEKPSNALWLAYVGTLGSSYSLIEVIDAISLLQKDNKAQSLRLIVMGDGLLRDQFEQHAKNKKVPVTFLGQLDYPKMVAQLSVCDFAINPIRKGSAGSIINKVGEYAAAGLAVINTQECKEYRDLLEQYQAGINCENGNIDQLASAIFRLFSDTKTRHDMGASNRKMAEHLFDRVTTYHSICELIINHENLNH